ncbi:MAG: class I SAM-dependent methyltransferase [Thermomicrobiales bacterium]
MIQTLPTTQVAYALGHAPRELQRLIDQARYFGDMTAHIFQLAGLGAGMRVLDIGCGAGDVAFLAASMVGPAGEVIGVDRSPDAVALATRRAAEGGLTNVRFVVGDIADLALDEPVDALVGRLVLMYLTDPAVVLRRLATLVRPGGLIICHEFDMTRAMADPPSQLFAEATDRITQALNRAGADSRAGLHLRRTFLEAGLLAPQQFLHARVEHGPEAPGLRPGRRDHPYAAAGDGAHRGRHRRAGRHRHPRRAAARRGAGAGRHADLPAFIGAWSRKEATY